MSVLNDPRAVANLLLIEVGNSHITLAESRDGRLRELQRFENVRAADLSDSLTQAWTDLPAQRLRAAVLASVVPEATDQLKSQLSDSLDIDPLVLGDDITIPIDVGSLAKPRSVGIDRLCSATAAFDEIQSACCVASFGTATTIDCVDDAGRFRGGAILPGLALQAWSLHQRTAQLPQVEITAPTSVYGGETREAIVNGIVYGANGALREIVERYATDLGKWPRLVLTGGFAPLMREVCEFVDAWVPDLVLRGMVLAYRQYFTSDQDE